MKKCIVALVTLFVLFSCGESKSSVVKTIAEGEKIHVTTSIVPLASITNFIGWDNIEVNNLVPAWVSPHGFSLSPQDMIHVQKSDIVFLLGIQDIDGFLFKSLSGVKSIALDDWLQVLDSVSEHNHDDHAGEEEEHSEEEHSEEGHEYQYILDAQNNHDHDGDWIPDHAEEEHSEEDHTEDEHEEHEEDWDVNKYLSEEWEWHVHAEASIDPHVWTGKVNSLIMAKRIQLELSKLQPSQADIFASNYDRFETVLTAIFEDFEKKVEWKTLKEFIVFHDAYNYLLLDAWIDSEKKIVFRSNVMSEPGSAKMKELVDEVKLHGVKEFFIEPQFESKALDNLAQENGATIFRLDPLGNGIDAGNFLENISANLEALSNIYE